MVHLPRIAVGTVQGSAANQPVLWALFDVLERSGRHLQTFLSQARFVALNGALPITGQSHRHLDSWVMTPDVCRELFFHGTRGSDVAIVGGRYDSALSGTKAVQVGGSLDTLCGWLDLPRLAIVDVTQLDGCRLPQRPARLDGILLDRVSGRTEACWHRANLEALWGVPVLGSLEELAAVRVVIENMPPGASPSRQLCRALGSRLEQTLRLDRLLDIAEQREFPSVPVRLFCPCSRTSLNVAVAYDEAFNCYFQDTLDLLESQGATIRDFSPLRHEALPPDTDVVYLGCGRAEQFADQLASNHCMKQSLRGHIQQRGRIYAEGSGLAYLCQQMVLEGGRQVPMVGALPAQAQFNAQAESLQPVEITLAQTSWLGEACSQLRGYLNTRWLIEPVGPLRSYAAELEHRTTLVGRHNIFGSCVHLDFAAQPQFLRSFFRPFSGTNVSVAF